MLDADYGYGLGPFNFLDLIAAEYPTLADTVYLDHAASPPAPHSSVQAFATSLASNLYSNPHSQSSSSIHTSNEIDRIRSKVLHDLFNVKNSGEHQWDLIFTSGTTASLKLVGDCFPWNGKSTRYRYLKESHTSLVGVRGCALAKGVRVEAVDIDDVGQLKDVEGETCLLGYPAQCNVTGSRIDLELARSVKRRCKNTAVLIDAAAYMATRTLDLESIPYEEAPDFIAMSFYKIYVSTLYF